MNVFSLSSSEKSAMIAKGAIWIVYAHYAHADRERGEVVSWHKSYGAAAKASKSSFLGIQELCYIDTFGDCAGKPDYLFA